MTDSAHAEYTELLKDRNAVVLVSVTPVNEEPEARQ